MMMNDDGSHAARSLRGSKIERSFWRRRRARRRQRRPPNEARPANHVINVKADEGENADQERSCISPCVIVTIIALIIIGLALLNTGGKAEEESLARSPLETLLDSPPPETKPGDIKTTLGALLGAVGVWTICSSQKSEASDLAGTSTTHDPQDQTGTSVLQDWGLVILGVPVISWLVYKFVWPSPKRKSPRHKSKIHSFEESETETEDSPEVAPRMAPVPVDQARPERMDSHRNVPAASSIPRPTGHTDPETTPQPPSSAKTVRQTAQKASRQTVRARSQKASRSANTSGGSHAPTASSAGPNAPERGFRKCCSCFTEKPLDQFQDWCGSGIIEMHPCVECFYSALAARSDNPACVCMTGNVCNSILDKLDHLEEVLSVYNSEKYRKLLRKLRKLHQRREECLDSDRYPNRATCRFFRRHDERKPQPGKCKYMLGCSDVPRYEITIKEHDAKTATCPGCEVKKDTKWWVDIIECGRCGYPFERAKGCTHMTCRNVLRTKDGVFVGICGKEWCWLCGGPCDSNRKIPCLANCGIYSRSIGDVEGEQYAMPGATTGDWDEMEEFIKAQQDRYIPELTALQNRTQEACMWTKGPDERLKLLDEIERDISALEDRFRAGPQTPGVDMKIRILKAQIYNGRRM